MALLFLFLSLQAQLLGIETGGIGYVIQLFAIVPFFPKIQFIIQAVTYNGTYLLTAGFLTLVFIQLYALVGFFQYPEEWYHGDPTTDMLENQCDSMLHCFLSSIYYGIRQGQGPGDFAEDMKYTNFTKYMSRFFYDMTYWFILNVIIMNIFFGIILDTFAELRNNQEKIDHDDQTKCFVCNLQRQDFERVGKGFDQHQQIEHNQWNYIFFAYSLKRTKTFSNNNETLTFKNRDSMEYNGIEYEVYRQIQEDTFKWLPLKKALSIQKIVQQEQNQEKADIIEIKKQLKMSQEQCKQIQKDTRYNMMKIQEDFKKIKNKFKKGG